MPILPSEMTEFTTHWHLVFFLSLCPSGVCSSSPAGTPEAQCTLFPSSLHWMWCRAVSTELQVLTQICLQPAIWRETWIQDGGNGWENSCDHDMNRAGTGQSMLVPSDLGAGTQWVLSYPSRSLTACWSCGEGEKEASPWVFVAAAELKVTPLLLSSHKASHPLWAETQCEGLPPHPTPPSPNGSF